MSDPTLAHWLTSERLRFLGAFASAWSGLNDWYRRDPRFSNLHDRAAVDTLQGLPPTDPLIAALDQVLADDDDRAQRAARLVNDAGYIGAVLYEIPSLFSTLVRDVLNHSLLRRSVWVAGSSKPTGRPTRELGIAYVNETLYSNWYQEMRRAQSGSECMAEPTISVQEALAHKGILADGSSFFVGTPCTSASVASVAAFHARLATDSVYQRLLAAVPATAPGGGTPPSQRASLAIELLYLVRNNVTHGSLDPTDEANDAVGKAAYELIHAWLVEFAT